MLAQRREFALAQPPQGTPPWVPGENHPVGPKQTGRGCQLSPSVHLWALGQLAYQEGNKDSDILTIINRFPCQHEPEIS